MGSVYVLNKDLEMRSMVTLQKKLSGMYISNGILFVLSFNDITFLNMLGGNAVLLKCHNHDGIFDVVYDYANVLLFIFKWGQKRS